MAFFNLLRFITPNASVSVSKAANDLSSTAALGQAVENLDTYAARINGTNTFTSAGTLDLSSASTSTGLKLPQGTAAAPTAEGAIAWDTDDDLLKVGDGSTTKTMVSTTSTQTLTNKTLTSPSMTSPTVSSGGLTVSGGASTIGATGANSGAWALTVQGNSTSGDSFGLHLLAGSTSGDAALDVLNESGAISYFKVAGDGGVTLDSPTGGDKGAGTINVASDYYINGTGVLSFALQLQNGTDQGHKLQRVASGSVTTSNTHGSVFLGSSGSLSWAATFGSTPKVMIGNATTTSGMTWPSNYSAVSTTAVTADMGGSSATDAGTLEIWGIG